MKARLKLIEARPHSSPSVTVKANFLNKVIYIHLTARRDAEVKLIQRDQANRFGLPDNDRKKFLEVLRGPQISSYIPKKREPQAYLGEIFGKLVKVRIW